MEEVKLLPLDVSTLSEDVIEILLFCDSSTQPSLIDEIAHKNIHRPKVLRYVLNHPLTSEQTKHFVSETLRVYADLMTRIKSKAGIKDKPLAESRPQSLLQRMQRLKAGEKIQLALRGGRDVRSILLRDSNKEIMLSVMNNPKITESEIELLAEQKNTPVEVLKIIAKKREWLRTYPIVHALVKNPKTPIEIAQKYVHALRPKDLLLLGRSKNVSEAIRSVAKKLSTVRSH